MPINDELIIFRKDDGSFSVLHILDQEHKNISKDDFAKAHTEKIESLPRFANTTKFVIDEADYFNLSRQSAYGKRAIKCDEFGKLYIDKNYKSPEEIRDEKIASLKKKLMGLNLSDEEFGLILK